MTYWKQFRVYFFFFSNSNIMCTWFSWLHENISYQFFWLKSLSLNRYYFQKLTQIEENTMLSWDSYPVLFSRDCNTWSQCCPNLLLLHLFPAWYSFYKCSCLFPSFPMWWHHRTLDANRKQFSSRIERGAVTNEVNN